VLTQEAIIKTGSSLNSLVKLGLISEAAIYHQYIDADCRYSTPKFKYYYYDGVDLYKIKYIRFGPPGKDKYGFFGYHENKDSKYYIHHSYIVEPDEIHLILPKDMFVQEQNFNFLKGKKWYSSFRPFEGFT
jgi:hypothetical protein